MTIPEMLNAAGDIAAIIQAFIAFRGTPKAKAGVKGMNDPTTIMLSKRRLQVLIGISVLICISSGVSVWTRPSYKIIAPQDFEHIVGRNFANQEVVIDGKSFEGCTFVNVRLKFNGTSNTQLDNDHFVGTTIMDSDNPAIKAAWTVAKGLGGMRNIPFVDDNGFPDTSVKDPESH